MFEQFRNIDSAFKLSRLVALASVISSFLLCLFMIWYSHKTIREKEQKVLVIANSKIFEAYAEERQKYWPIEIRDHVRTFHNLFFTLHPDEKAITRNINKALYLADHSAANEYNNLKESGFYSSLISANTSQEIECDAIEEDLNSTPWYFKYSGTIKIIRPTTIVTRTLVTEGVLRVTQPSDNNPHGLLIERWRVLENKDIKTERR